MTPNRNKRTPNNFKPTPNPDFYVINGPYQGWLGYGPYTRNNREFVELRYGSKARKQFSASTFDWSTASIENPAKKPFIDWLSPWPNTTNAQNAGKQDR